MALRREGLSRRQIRDRLHVDNNDSDEVGTMTDRELFLLGVGLYWAEGTKSKPYRTQERVTFVNSDPGMIEVFLAWLRLLRVDDDRLRFHVLTHETADVAGAERFWADLTGGRTAAFGKTSIKKHIPKTNRKNVGENCHDCLAVRVLQSAELYRRIEGSWYGIVLGASPASRHDVRFSRD